MSKVSQRAIGSTVDSASQALTEIDLSKLTRVVGRGIFAAKTRGTKPLKAKYAVVDDDSLSVLLQDGRRVAVPLSWYPRLEHSTPAERNDWKLVMDGRAISWRHLGVAVSVKALLEGEKSNEAPASLKKWIARRRAIRAKSKAD